MNLTDKHHTKVNGVGGGKFNQNFQKIKNSLFLRGKLVYFLSLS